MCVREREGMSYKESASLRATQGSRDKLHLNNSIFRAAWWLYVNAEKVCVLVHICTYMQLCMCDCVYEIHVHSRVQCVHVSLPACSRKKKHAPGGSKGYTVSRPMTDVVTYIIQRYMG